MPAFSEADFCELSNLELRSKSHGRVHEDDIDIDIKHDDHRQHDGVHHGRGRNDVEGRELALVDPRDQRRYVKQEDPRERLWTEITVDLVSEEAIRERGYEYTRSGGNYYVYKYLKYVSVMADIFPYDTLRYMLDNAVYLKDLELTAYLCNRKMCKISLI